MAVHSTDAIVLRRYPFRETSVIVSCLTPEFGKIKGLIKGLRRPSRSYRSPMEPITRNRIVFYGTRTSQLHLITQCELLNALSSLQQDWETAKLAALCVDLAEVVVPLEEPQPKIYNLLRDTLERLALPGADLRVLRLGYILRLLRLAGFEPQMDQCTGCNARVLGAAHWSARQGGLLCGRCLHQDARAEAVSAEQLAFLQLLSDQDTLPLAMDAELLALWRRHLDEFLHWRLERPLKTQRV